ncbi:MAG: PspC domain-containing protein [Marinilabiliaceae bacterium]|nr:PspC domain-containing protein [Bacteroidales bacterium]
MDKRLEKSSDRIICGICGGVAEYFNIDKTIVRAVWALGTICTAFAGGILYVVLMFIMPEKNQPAK